MDVQLDMEKLVTTANHHKCWLAKNTTLAYLIMHTIGHLPSFILHTFTL